MKPELSREQLYEKVWSVPLLKLAAEFQISSVALAKRCRKLNIPVPPRGYWAKIEAGKKVVRPPLPTETQPKPVLSEPQFHSVWPRDVSGLCDRAQQLLTTLQNEKPSYDGLQRTDGVLFPRIYVSKASAERAARAFHAILMTVEAVGVPFRKARGKYGPAYFEHAHGRLYVEIKEPLKQSGSYYPYNRPPDAPSGILGVYIGTETYGRGWSRSWTEDKDGGMRQIVAKLGDAVNEFFEQARKKRAEDEEKARIERERWMKEEEERKKRDHQQALTDAKRIREQDLFRAAVWAGLHADVMKFLTECEAKWMRLGEMTADQRAWLEWAKATAEAWSPWADGYPNPTRDGPFDPSTVAFGGPYPPTRNFPRPPNMPEVPRPEPQYSFGPRKDPYPFWLRYPR